MVALCLLKHICAMEDYRGKPYSLNYLRTKDGLEVDFCVVNKDKPELMLEVKSSDSTPGKAIVGFREKYDIQGTQVVLHLKRERLEKGIEVRRGRDYLKSLIL